MRIRFSLLPLAALCGVSAVAQPAGSAYQDDVPIAEYLAMVEQVAPAAREGADIFMAAFRERCGRAIRVSELRAAFADGAGDPILMGMIRAAHAKDGAALTHLRAALRCPRG
ncbi:MAG: hypothetical protein ABI589_02015 [Burkholderiales bacterium]